MNKEFGESQPEGVNKELEAKVKLLRERLESGGVSREEIQIAASLGHDAAGIVEPIKNPEEALNRPVPNQRELYQRVFEVIERFPKDRKREAAVRIAIETARTVLGLFESENPDSSTPRKAIESSEDWVLSPDDQRHLSSLRTTYQQAYELSEDQKKSKSARQAARSAAYTAYLAFNNEAEGGDQKYLSAALDATYDYRNRDDTRSLTQIKEAYQTALTQWLAKEEDPVQKRVDQRQKNK